MRVNAPTRLAGRLAPPLHQVDGTGKPSPVGPCLAVDQEGIGASVEDVDQHQELAAGGPAGGTEREVKEGSAGGFRGPDLGGVPWVLNDPPLRFKIDPEADGRGSAVQAGWWVGPSE